MSWSFTAATAAARKVWNDSLMAGPGMRGIAAALPAQRVNAQQPSAPRFARGSPLQGTQLGFGTCRCCGVSPRVQSRAAP